MYWDLELSHFNYACYLMHLNSMVDDIISDINPPAKFIWLVIITNYFTPSIRMSYIGHIMSIVTYFHCSSWTIFILQCVILSLFDRFSIIHWFRIKWIKLEPPTHTLMQSYVFIYLVLFYLISYPIPSILTHSHPSIPPLINIEF